MIECDVLIIGAGQAGIPLARRLAESGKQVAIAERKHLGGSCINFGCTPSKAVIASARVAHLVRRANEFGIVIPEHRIEFPRVINRARHIVEGAKESLAKGLNECGAEILTGNATLTGRDHHKFLFKVDDIIGRASKVVINSGTRTLLPQTAGLNQVPYLHAGNWLEQHTLPEHILFLGAGYIAIEMAQFYRRMGARVTVVGADLQILPHEDSDVSSAIQSILEAEGIVFRLNARVTGVKARKDQIEILLEGNAQSETVSASHLFVATGRRPNTDDLGIETIGLKTNDHGYFEVDDRLSTSVPGVWAAGDVRGGPMFTHASWDDHRILESQLLGDGSRTKAARIIPYAIFTDPELGRVGMTEVEARHQHGEHVRVAKFEIKQNGKATEVGQTLGFIKLIADIRDGRLLGAAVLASEGAELVASLITLMNANVTLEAVCRGIYIHPTLSEAVQSAAVALQLQLDTHH